MLFIYFSLVICSLEEYENGKKAEKEKHLSVIPAFLGLRDC